MIENDFKYSLNCHHYGDYSCEQSGCHDEGICRCYKINKIEIISVDITRITEKIFSQLNEDDSQHKRDKTITNILFDYDSDLVNKYCIHRILTILKVWDFDNWNAQIVAGYYGDEIGDVLIKSELFDTISTHINQVLNLETLKSKIEYILKLEYGYILDSLKDKEYSVIQVNVEDLDFGQDKQLKNVLHKNLEYYSDKEYLRDSIRGVAYYSQSKWRVVDGYHRLTQTKFPKVRIIGIK
jgi:hypothetical protein